MKYLTFLLPLILLNSCFQKKSTSEKSAPTRIAYVGNPNPTDTLCIRDIQRAKEDLQNGRFVFTQPVSLATGRLRYEDELRRLCEKHGLIFDVDLIGCVIFKGQSQGCYGHYMDEMLKDKFGPEFKARLHAQADSLFLVNVSSTNTTVQYWDCDERPRLPHESKRSNDYLPNIIVSDIDIKANKGEWPFFDLGFVVEQDSTISSFYVRGFVAASSENEKYKDKLFSAAVQHIKSKYPTWVPGKIKGVAVRTDNNVRVFLNR